MKKIVSILILFLLTSCNLMSMISGDKTSISSEFLDKIKVQGSDEPTDIFYLSNAIIDTVEKNFATFSYEVDYTNKTRVKVTSCEVSDIHNLSEVTCSCDTDSNCSVSIKATSGVTGEASYHLRLRNEIGLWSNTASVHLLIRVDSTGFKCPIGFVLVLENKEFSTNKFCLQAAEARVDQGLDAVDYEELPTRVNALAAYEHCNNLNLDTSVEGYRFGLISNPEWMTIARSIEGTAGNWSGIAGLPVEAGNGIIARGHADQTPSSPIGMKSLDSDPFSNTESPVTHSLQLQRTHLLASGHTVWDFAGNLSEWVDWDHIDDELTAYPREANNYQAHNWTSYLNLPMGDGVGLSFRELGSVNSILQNESYLLGHFFSTSSNLSKKILLRGGSYNDGFAAGIYAANLHYKKSAIVENDVGAGGVRCVLREISN